MNKRHLAIFISIGLLIGIAVLVLMIRTGGARDIALLLANGDKPAVSEHIKPSKTKDWMSEPARASEKPSLTAMKPKSIKMGEGATAVVEIDHGLQAVDLTKGDRYSAAVDKACDKGAQGAVTFSVVDDRGQPVPGATVKAAFSNRRQAGHDFEKTTDENGLVALQDTCVGDLNFRILKDGHYDTRLRYWFFKAWFDCAEDGRWLPWNPVIEIVLKRKVNPVAMHVKPKLKKVKPPVSNTWVGFDFQVCDFVKPYGKGVSTDLLMNSEFIPGENILYYRGVTSILSTNAWDGVYKAKLDESSVMQTVYLADTNAAFQQAMSFSYHRPVDKVEEDTRLKDDEYLVARIRSRTDANGNLISAHYVKIVGTIEADEGGIWFASYFNPNENDSNLEADTSRNLLDPRDLGFAP
jgi:hypothetical protein